MSKPQGNASKKFVSWQRRTKHPLFAHPERYIRPNSWISRAIQLILLLLPQKGEQEFRDEDRLPAQYARRGRRRTD